MTRLILTAEQARVVAGAIEPIQLCDPAGRALATIQPLVSAEELAEAKKRAASPGPWYTGAQVQARLRALQEEWDRTSGFDEAYLGAFLRGMNAADPGHRRPRE